VQQGVYRGGGFWGGGATPACSDGYGTEAGGAGVSGGGGEEKGAEVIRAVDFLPVV